MSDLDFEETLGVLVERLDAYVLVHVFSHAGALSDEERIPAALLVGKLRRGVSGHEFASEEPRDEDVTFFVGADEPGIKSCFFLSPRTFRRAFEEGTALVIFAGHAIYAIRAVDDEQVDAIESARAASSSAALRLAFEGAVADLEAEWRDEEDADA